LRGSIRNVSTGIGAAITIDTLEAENVEADSATIRGEITELTNFGEDAEVFFEWGEDSEGLPNTTDIQLQDTVGVFTEDLTNLSIDTTHEFQAFGSVRDVSDDGVVLTFETGGAIPDSGLLHDYSAQALSLSDGTTVNTWADNKASRDLDGIGGPTYDESGINGVEAVFVDGVDDEFWDGGTEDTITQPFYIFSVYQAIPDGDAWLIGSDESELLGSNGSRFAKLLSINSSGRQYRIDAGSELATGTSDEEPHIFTGLFDGFNSEIRLDGETIATGSTGTNGLTTVVLGSSGGERYIETKIGRVSFYDANEVSNEQVNEIENVLANQFGITI